MPATLLSSKSLIYLLQIRTSCFQHYRHTTRGKTNLGFYLPFIPNILENSVSFFPHFKLITSYISTPSWAQAINPPGSQQSPLSALFFCPIVPVLFLTKHPEWFCQHLLHHFSLNPAKSFFPHSINSNPISLPYLTLQFPTDLSCSPL
jgi:hypothetical protein